MWYYLCMKIAPNMYTVEPSRYGQHRTVCRVDENRFIIEGPCRYTRGAVDDDGSPVMCDFEGGPFIYQGMGLELAMGEAPCIPEGKTVKSARWLSAEQYGELIGLTDSHWIKAFTKPDYAYCLVETV